MATITISGGDKYCRYLSAPGSDTNSIQFGKFLERLGIEPPINLREIIKIGWINPVFRIRLPDSFYLNWTYYPVISDMNYTHEDEWAAKFYIRCVTNHPETAKNYAHYLDRRALLVVVITVLDA
jgi:hypothetical protein